MPTDTTLKIKKAYPLAYSRSTEYSAEGVADLNKYRFSLVGKVRPWDDFDNEYVIYADGDLILVEAEVAVPTVDESDPPNPQRAIHDNEEDYWEGD